MNKQRQYRFGLGLGCKGTDCLIKWSGEMHRHRAGETLLLLAGVGPNLLQLTLAKLPAKLQGSTFLQASSKESQYLHTQNLPGNMWGPGNTRGTFHSSVPGGSGGSVGTDVLWALPEVEYPALLLEQKKSKQMAQRKILLSRVTLYVTASICYG